jgi:predicted RNA-binding Zn ribbon-like protein
VRFVNTRYLLRGQPQDLLGSADSALDWLRSQDDLAELGIGQLAEADLNQTQLLALDELRDALAELFGCADRPLPADQVATLNTMCRLSPTWLEFDVHGRRRTRRQGSPLGAVRSAIAADGIELLSRQAGLVRQCAAPSCVVFFVADRPRRQWCCAACGNRARVARHYQRQHAADTAR